jgi:hypothetical protein
MVFVQCYMLEELDSKRILSLGDFVVPASRPKRLKLREGYELNQ